MVKINLSAAENNILSMFSLVGGDMNEYARAKYMFNLCTNQINGVIDEVHLQLNVQGYGTDEELAVFLSSSISEVYPDFQPDINTDPLNLIDECHSFLTEEWGQSAIEIGLDRGWFVPIDEGGINLTPSYS